MQDITDMKKLKKRNQKKRHWQTNFNNSMVDAKSMKKIGHKSTNTKCLESKNEIRTNKNFGKNERSSQRFLCNILIVVRQNTRKRIQQNS